jgi:hypothetical protein
MNLAGAEIESIERWPSLTEELAGLDPSRASVFDLVLVEQFLNDHSDAGLASD